MKLYICEKPSQARDIAKELGAYNFKDGYIEGKGIAVTWALGHLLEMKGPETYEKNLKPWRLDVLPVIPETFQLKPKNKTKKQLKVVGSLLKKCTSVVISTDADREGEVIARELLDYFKFKGKIERLWLSALDAKSIRHALNNMKNDVFSKGLYFSGVGRSRADWLIGMNMTMATSALFGKRGEGVLSVGRVQTPTLKLIVDRDLQIESFKSTTYFDFILGFNEGITAKWHAPETITDLDGYVTNKSHALDVKNNTENKPAVVTSYAEKELVKSPPLCFSLSALQKACNEKFSFSAKKTLTIAQALYEKHKATSYPRSDCNFLPEEQYPESKTILSNLFKISELSKLYQLSDFDSSCKSKVWNTKKVTAHHAIIPTQKLINIEDLSDDERKVFLLIVKYYISQFFVDNVSIKKDIEILCENEIFKATAQVTKIEGWKSVLKNNEKGEADLPDIKTDQEIMSQSGQIEEKKTKPKNHFSEGTLISALKNVSKLIDDPNLKKKLNETSGIGTEATRADIIEKLLLRDYIKRKKSLLISTEKGRRLIDLLPSNMSCPGMTAIWENRLSEVENGSLDLNDFVLDMVDVLDLMLSELKKPKEII